MLPITGRFSFDEPIEIEASACSGPRPLLALNGGSRTISFLFLLLAVVFRSSVLPFCRRGSRAPRSKIAGMEAVGSLPNRRGTVPDARGLEDFVALKQLLRPKEFGIQWKWNYLLPEIGKG
ncbi:uncharacterized protein ACOB8E_005250 isoform 2-T3 [Sarcophilus harrisii]